MKQIIPLLLGLLVLSGCAGTAGVASRAVETEQIRETVAPGKVHEMCYDLAKGQEVSYRFEATRTVDFNLHVHEDSGIEYPIEKNGVQRSEGSYTAPKDQVYCLMWTNRDAGHCRLDGSVTVRRQIKP